MKKETKIIALIGFKGGIGKTTSAVHLAGHLADALADQGTVKAVDGDERNRSLLNWAKPGKLPFTVISYIQSVSDSEHSDYIVIDVRGGLPDTELLDMACICDLMLIPANPEIMSIDSMRKTFEVLEELKEQNPQRWRAQVRAFMTMVRSGPDGPTKKLKESRDILGALNIPVLDSTIRLSEAFKDASSAGVLVSQTNSKLAQACWSDYEQLTEECLNLLQEGQK